jgi:hypothetical protein
LELVGVQLQWPWKNKKNFNSGISEAPRPYKKKEKKQLESPSYSKAS